MRLTALLLLGCQKAAAKQLGIRVHTIVGTLALLFLRVIWHYELSRCGNGIIWGEMFLHFSLTSGLSACQVAIVRSYFHVLWRVALTRCCCHDSMLSACLCLVLLALIPRSVPILPGDTRGFHDSLHSFITSLILLVTTPLKFYLLSISPQHLSSRFVSEALAAMSASWSDHAYVMV